MKSEAVRKCSHSGRLYRRLLRSDVTECGVRVPLSSLESRLDELRRQREPTIARLRSTPTPQLWAAPEDGWSAGQWLEHLVRTLRLQRRVLAVWIRVARPLARIRRDRPYITETTDLFGTAPARVPGPFAGTRPKAHRRHPVSLDGLLTEWEAETQRLGRVMSGLDDATAGHLKVWDGPYGLVNLHQAMQHLCHHERNDLEHIDAVLDEGAIDGPE